MNLMAERSRSLWMDVALPQFPALAEDVRCDVVVVGAGIAGLSTAYELAQLGRKVVVVDRGAPGGGITLRTSAHLTFYLDDYYAELIKRRDREAAIQYLASQSAAVDRVEAIAANERIACDFARVDGFLVAIDSDGESILRDELAAITDIGWQGVSRVPPPPGFRNDTIRYPSQARFHPAKYLRGLLAALERLGVRVFCDTAVLGVSENGAGVLAECAGGRRITAGIAVIATNSPINDLVAIHTKQAPYRTYVIAGPVPKGAAPDALIYDTEDPYHYVRIQPAEDHDIMIVGGEDHKSGMENDGEHRIKRLERWAKAHFPMFGETTHAWSGQIYEPVDYAPHLGLNPGDKRTYVITGDSGEGLTSGVAGAMLIAQSVAQGGSPWAELYDPSRKTLAAAGTFVAENMDVVANLAEHLSSGEIGSVEELAAGQGALMRLHGKKAAVYRDEKGAIHAFSATCTHLGCVVQFNSFEKCWECPCHGSQFSAEGEVLAGPARKPLEPLDL
jgi:glycine/D-amino acid oxidase-like deaminating enzyme/nitrite reductase/ring-hydroxylating ferredoxin subunit